MASASGSSITNIHPCARCGLPSVQRCSNCRMVWYCSKECQKTNWPLHKWFCPVAYPEKNINKPAVRALFLPVDSPTPQFVEVPYKDMELIAGEQIPVPDYQLFLGEGPYKASTIAQFPSLGMAGVLRFHRIFIFFRLHFFIDGSKPNQCVAAITKGESGWFWKGPILVFENVLFPRYSECPQRIDIMKANCDVVARFFM